MSKILIIDDEAKIRRILSLMLTQHHFEIAEADSGEAGIVAAQEFKPDVVLLDLSMPGIDGLATLEALLAESNHPDCIIMTAFGSIRSAVEAMRRGAFDYLTKPFDNDELLIIIRRAISLRHLSNEVEELRQELSARYGFSEIVGISPAMQAVFRAIKKVSVVDATVLIEGESGTGKELVARAIHRHSPRSAGPFVPVNCGAIPATLFESELFGYERGAFTGAVGSKPGRVEQASTGTLFLDEIAELPLESQVKLLRALQDREITRLGGRSSIKVDARVIAATNIDLASAAEAGTFREDLYWRLNVVKIHLPSLRERREDIPLLIDHMLERFNRELGIQISKITPEARAMLLSYEWPGNVRELENTLCSGMIMSESGVIDVRDLPPRIRGEVVRSGAGEFAASTVTIADAVQEITQRMEKNLISSRLREFAGNRTATARSLGISRKTLFNKMRQYNLGADDEELE